MSPAPVKSAILNCIESVLFVTFCHADVLKTLISAFVLSRIDYCNSLLAGCPKQLIHKLKKLQNVAAKLIIRTSKCDHVFPVLHTLDWLPFEQRIRFRLLLLALKSVKDEGQSYLSDRLNICPTCLLHITSIRLKFFGQRKFFCQVSVLWNSLPYSLRQ